MSPSTYFEAPRAKSFRSFTDQEKAETAFGLSMKLWLREIFFPTSGFHALRFIGSKAVGMGSALNHKMKAPII